MHKLDISKSPPPQKEASFLAINPNGRIPALTDTFDDGKQIRLFESGSILQYLVATYDKNFQISYPPGSREFYETNNWLFFQMGGLGPMQVRQCPWVIAIERPWGKFLTIIAFRAKRITSSDMPQ